jgi:hypothetical protein
MAPRPRYKDTPVDEEKLKHFSRKFEEQDMFSDLEAGHKQDPAEEEKKKRAFYNFAEVDEPEEEKKTRKLKAKEAERLAKEEAKRKKQAKKDEEDRLKAAKKAEARGEAVPSSKVVVDAPEETAPPADAKDDAPAAPVAPTEPARPAAKAEALAIKQYQAKFADAQDVKIRRPILTGFLIGLGILLFFIVLGAILFSIAVATGKTVSELLASVI